MGGDPMIRGAEGWEQAVLGRRDGGKLTDSQDSFLFYYREIDPSRENFTLSATFTVEDASEADYQSGYGIMAVDTVASPSGECRHRNHALLGRFRTIQGRNYGYGLRIVSGYTDFLARFRKDRRRLDPSRLFPTQDDEDLLRKGDRRRFILIKTDRGFEAYMETDSGKESISFPGCDFLLKQDRHAIYVGFAVAGKVKLDVSDIVFETGPGKTSHTPAKALRHFIPDYPFDKRLLPAPAPADDVVRREMTFNVSPEGTPFDLASAIRQVSPGCEIILEDGVYPDGPYHIPEACCGKPRHPVILRARHPGKAVIDGSTMTQKLPALTLCGRFWILDGLVFRNAPSAGLFICGSDNLIRNCEACGNADTGILICTFPGTTRRAWPRRNRVEDCISHDNCDPMRCNADGFGAKLSVGKGNGFYRCRAFRNVDDGFDLYTKSTLGPIGPVVLERCEAAFNTIGFKLGGERQRVRHRLKGCYAHDNARAGFKANSNPAFVRRQDLK